AAFAIVVVIDSAKGPNGDHGGMVAAPIFQRIAEASLRYLGVAPTVNPMPPVVVARHDEHAPPGTVGGPTAEQPVVSFVADGPPGTVPDVRGMSAREALRRLVTLGLNPRVSGDGVVVSQTPAPGEPLDAAAACTLVLERSPRRSPS